MHECIVLGTITENEDEIVGVTLIDLETLEKYDMTLGKVEEKVRRGDYKIRNISIENEEIEQRGNEFITIEASKDAETGIGAELPEYTVIGRFGEKFILASQSIETEFKTYSQLMHDLHSKKYMMFNNVRTELGRDSIQWYTWSDEEIKHGEDLNKYSKKSAILGVHCKYKEGIPGVYSTENVRVLENGRLEDELMLSALIGINFREEDYKYIKLSKNIRFIAPLVFAMKNIETLDMSESSITDLDSKALCECKALKIILPNKLLTIQNSAFNRCDYISSLIIPDSVLEIKKGAFAEMRSLRRIVMNERFHREALKMEFGSLRVVAIKRFDNDRFEVVLGE